MDVPLTPSPSSSTMKLGSESSYSMDDDPEYKIPRLYYADAPQSADVAPKPSSGSYDAAVILTLSLHFLVVLVHCVLLVIWATAWEQRVLVNADDAAHISTILDAILQVTILVLTTALIAVMAPLAIRTQFLRPQTLTALSDVSSSWNGLGISALTLYHNIRFPAAVIPVILTTVYFLALTALHVTTPLILTVPIVEVTRQQMAPTVVGTLDVQNMFPSGHVLPSNFSDVRFDWYRSSGSLDLLSNVTCDHLGLKDNRVYDTLISPLSSTNASAPVNYTDFNVRCGELPQSPVITTQLKSRVYHGRTVTDPSATSLSIVLGDKENLGTLTDSFKIAVPFLSDGSSYIPIHDDLIATKLWSPADVLVRIPYFTPSVQGAANMRNIYLYSVYNANRNGSSPILDSSGSPGRPVAIEAHGLQLHPGSVNNPINSQVFVQVIGCSLSTQSGEMTLDATTNRISDASLFSETRTRTWDDWLPDNTSSNNLADMWGNMFAPSSSMTLWRESLDQDSQLGTEWSCINPSQMNLTDHSEITNTTQSCHIPTVVEQYLTDSLFGQPHTSNGWMWNNATMVHTDFANATLVTLEDTLSKATAMIMWIAARARTISTFAVVDQIEMEFRPEPQTGFTMVEETILRGRLTINFTILALGTAASIVLLLIAIDILAPQIRTAESVQGRAPLDGVSLLQIASLDTACITDRLAGVDRNATEARRRAGLFMVVVVDGKLVPIAKRAEKGEERVVMLSSAGRRKQSNGDEEDERYLLSYTTK